MNTIVTDTTNGAHHLILWIAAGGLNGYWHDLSSTTRTPKEFIVDDVVAGISNGRYETDIYKPQLRPEELLTPKERAYRDRNWSIIREIVEQEPEIYEKHQRPKLLKAASGKSGVKANNIYALLDRYWRSGKSKNGILPLYTNCGGKGRQRKEPPQSTGKTNPSRENIKILDDADYSNFERAIRKYYLTRERRSFKSTYEKLLQDSYTHKEKSGKLKLLAPSETPTFRQFQYWFKKNSDVINTSKKRGGEREFELNGRAVLGKSDYGLMGPGAQFQVDATVGDVYLVSQFDRSSIIGRPVMYFIIDAFSRLVVGMSVCLEGPSWNALAAALINMASDKVAFCKQYGIEISKNEWPCHHVPASLLGDRGELMSKNADALVDLFGIRIVNAPPYRADLKGIACQHFRTINTNAVALLPGSVKPDMSKRGGRDYRFDATLDIRQFTQIIIKCVVNYNNHHYMDSFNKNDAMDATGVDAVPVRLWEWGIGNCSGALRVFPEEIVKFAVLPTASATVTEKGIRFKGLFYACDRAKSEMWFEKARAKKYWPVAVSYDPREMTNIYIWDDDSKRYDTCYLLDWNSKNTGKALAEIIYEQQKERLEGKKLKATAMEAKINLNAEIDSIVAEAKQMAKSNPAKSKKERLSNIRENRAAERAQIQNGEAVPEMPVSESPTYRPLQGAPEEEMSPVLRMIKEKAEERLKNG